VSASIYETLQNADRNLQSNTRIGLSIGKRQLHNAVALLKTGYSLREQGSVLLDEYSVVDNALDKP
jgi:hypothetical protein